MSKIKIHVHYPETEEGIKILKNRITESHKTAIIDYITKLPEGIDKKAFLNTIISETAKAVD